MLEALPKATFSMLANSTLLKKAASRYGMRKPTSFARRFVAGETLDEAVATARAIEAAGMTVTLDHLGERVGSRESATAATLAYIDVVEAVMASGISRNLSVKLTQLGLDIDRATSTDNLRRVLDAADKANVFVRIDMESSAYTQQTFETFETVWSIGCRNVGIVIQACLKRSAADVRRVNELGARVRLVKGAYRERRDMAFQQKDEVDASFLELMKMLLTSGTYPAIATHDDVMIEATRAFASSRVRQLTAREASDPTAGHPDPDGFEFQMLYGVRRDLQRRVAAAGYPVRVYLPFGKDWFPYFMRRLGERPANVGFVLKSLFREDAAAQ
jgi:proline dehydrogenase